jgi:copper chaperone CopZ
LLTTLPIGLSSCVKTIEAVLGSTDGISDIHVDLATEKASITSILSIEELVAALDEIGTARN